MTNGSVILNGLTDKQLVTVLETKIRHEGVVLFNPQLIQQVQLNPPKPGVLLNNNVIVGWSTEAGFKAVIELQAELLNHRLVAKEAA
jgi:hypothetical protein